VGLLLGEGLGGGAVATSDCGVWWWLGEGSSFADLMHCCWPSVGLDLAAVGKR